MIELRRERPLRIGHRGAAALAPENTIASFERALELGVDLVEFDVLPAGGSLVVAHDRSVAAGAPGLGEVLDFFAARPAAGLHADLKLGEPEDARRFAAAVEERGLAGRTVVSGFRVAALRAVGEAAPSIRIGFTFPEDRAGVSGRRALRPVVAGGAAALRAVLPLRVPAMLRRAGATALMLQHQVVSRAAVERAHAQGAAVVAWTVDDPVSLARVLAAGVDGVVSNDPRVFSQDVATLAP